MLRAMECRGKWGLKESPSDKGRMMPDEAGKVDKDHITQNLLKDFILRAVECVEGFLAWQI